MELTYEPQIVLDHLINASRAPSDKIVASAIKAVLRKVAYHHTPSDPLSMGANQQAALDKLKIAVALDLLMDMADTDAKQTALCAVVDMITTDHPQDVENFSYTIADCAEQMQQAMQEWDDGPLRRVIAGVM